MNFARMGGRRFTLALGAGVVSSVLVWFAKIDSSTYAAVIIGCVGAYIGGSTVEQMNLDKISRRKRQGDDDDGHAPS